MNTTTDIRDASWLRSIACLSTSRADAGIYRPLLEALARSSRWEVTCLAAGTHTEGEFGRTIADFEDLRGVRITPVSHHQAGDSPEAVSASAGRGIIEVSKALSQGRADILFVLGDRTEMLAGSLAGLIHGMPICHLHGGDVTQGAYDDQCRHAISMLAHLHFPALAAHGERLASMGEERWRIHSVGAMALDGLRTFAPEPIESLNAEMGLDFRRPTMIVVFHPETLAALTAERQVTEVLAALEGFEGNILVIGPNADVGHRSIQSAFLRFTASRPGAKLFASLTQRRFWSCLAHAQVLMGNSSAGILEAASFRLPVVNVGARQEGRLRAGNVIDAPVERRAIADALCRAVDPSFRASLANLTNPYGDGRAAERIIEVLERLPDRQTLIRKGWARNEQQAAAADRQ